MNNRSSNNSFRKYEGGFTTPKYEEGLPKLPLTTGSLDKFLDLKTSPAERVIASGNLTADIFGFTGMSDTLVAKELQEIYPFIPLKVLTCMQN